MWCRYCCLVEDPGSPEHAEEIGELLCGEGLYVDGLHMINAALSRVTEVVQQSPMKTAPDAYVAPLLVVRGRLHARTAEFDKALSDFSRAIEHAPTLYNAYFHRAVLLRMCNPLVALNDIRSFFKHRGKQSSDELLSIGFYLRGLINLRLGNRSDAITGVMQSLISLAKRGECEKLQLCALQIFGPAQNSDLLPQVL